MVESSLCWWIDVEGVAAPTDAHLHAGAVGTNGPIVATLYPFFPDEAMCVKHDDPAVIQAIIDDPSAFYVDVHTVEFPDGALRGQLPILNCVLKVGSEKATGPADDVTLAVGEELWVIGDFVPDSEVVIDFRREGGSVTATVTVTADADGEFGLVHDFSTGDEGTWLIEGRVDGTDCADSAEVTVTQGEVPVPPGEGGRGATTGSPTPEASTLPDTAVAAAEEGTRSAAMLVLATIGVVLMARGLARRR